MSDNTKSTDPENAKLFKKSENEEDEILKPKRVTSAYIYFVTSYIEQMRTSNSDKKQTELVSMAGLKW
jgi:hypothetical protein